MLKPIATVAETVAKPEMPIEEVQNKENEARELPPTTDVRADLESVSYTHLTLPTNREV